MNNIYYYSGPIKRYGKIVSNKWSDETTAPSLSRAIVNLKFKAKKYLGLTRDAKVELNYSNIIEVSEEDYRNSKKTKRSYNPDYDIPDEWEGDFEDENLRLRDEVKVFAIYYTDDKGKDMTTIRAESEDEAEDKFLAKNPKAKEWTIRSYKFENPEEASRYDYRRDYKDCTVKVRDAEYADFDDGESPFNNFLELTRKASEYGLNTRIIYPDYITMKCSQWIISGNREALLNFISKYYNEDQIEYIMDCAYKVKDSDEDVYDVYYEDINTHKRGSFKRRTWNQVERLMNNKNLRTISVSPSEDENKQYSIDYYYNIYYEDMNNTYEEEKKALKEDYLPRYNLKLIGFYEVHDGGPDNCKITLKGTKSDLEKFIYDIGGEPEEFEFKS